MKRQPAPVAMTPRSSALLPEQEPCPFWIVLYTLEYIEEAKKRIEAREAARLKAAAEGQAVEVKLEEPVIA